MKMTFRWYGAKDDSIPLQYIRQIPGIGGVVSAVYDVPVGEVWPRERVRGLKNEVEGSGLGLEVIESVNVHEDIKLAAPARDRYIENYIKTLKNLAEIGIKCVCYNFMPVFDWTRTDLFKPLKDGSSAMFYDKRVIDKITDPSKMVRAMRRGSNGFSLPGWEPERLNRVGELFQAYQTVDEEGLRAALGYFLKAVIPYCERYDIKMAIHPDDPPWRIFGLPRIVKDERDIALLLELADSPYNGVTLCSGSLGASPANDIPAMIRKFGKAGRIHFAHVRNVLRQDDGSLCETSHLSSDGSLDLYDIMKAYHDVGFDGYMRPDHGRNIWDEKCRPGYGLYDRALGIAYLNGLDEAIKKGEKSDVI
ncbi:MAG: mannonate dehydratase [Clostridiales bacterium]|jgi:mannonate dehydratase|nr:mannonate dehydratase [Clostridiales bacterium]